MFRLDLHIHTVLSPCTEIAEMTPRAIVRMALGRGLDVIAICDHNSARNTAATRSAASGTGLLVIPGIEVTSSEEVHILGLFSSDEDALAVQEEVYARLYGENDEEAFGVQVVVDEHDMVEDIDQRLLIGATTMPADRVVRFIQSHGGLAVASHVDRPVFGIFSQLGFMPPDLRPDALEVSRLTDFDTVRAKYPQSREYTLVTSSDAHRLEDIGAAYTLAKMAEPSFEELSKAVRGHAGRGIVAGKRREDQ